MSNDSLLTAVLREVGHEGASLGASPVVRERLMTEMRAIADRERRAAFRRNLLAFAAAAAITAAVGASAWQSFERRSAAPAGPGATLASREITTDFMPLTYSGVPITGGHIVRLEVPKSSLASFGLMTPDAAQTLQSGDTVLADVIVGDDGLARAVRFVRTTP